MNRSIVCFSLTAILGLLSFGPTRSSYAAILFDPDGGGPAAAIDLGLFDWHPGNAFAEGGNAAVAAFPAIVPFNFFYQARLSSTSDSAGAPNTPANLGPGGANELTLVVAATEIVTFAMGIGPGAVATFALAPVQTVNYFEIWFDPTRDGNDLQGTGFNSYAVAPAPGAAGTGTNAVLAADADAVLILSGRIDTLSSSFFAAAPIGNLDQFGGDNYGPGAAGPGGVGIDTVSGTGGTSLEIDASILYYDPVFFPASIIDRISFASFVGVPFITADPSARFLTTGLGLAGGTAATTVSTGVVPVADGAGDPTGASLGAINGADPAGAGGPDFQFLVDGNNSFQGQVIPEPASLTLFGILFGGMGLGAIRRRRSGSRS